MKRGAMIAIALFAASVVSVSSFANVRVEAIQRSTQKVRLNVSKDHAPIVNAKIEILNQDEKPLPFALSTGAAGVANLPLLKPGHYHVVASADGGLHADLYLDVSKNGKKTTVFSLDLFVEPPPLPSFQERLAAAEKEATAVQLAKFNGVVKDQVGAAVARTKVEIYRRGAFADGPVATSDADTTGDFSSHLSDGSYTAVFSCSGFSPEIALFDIVRGSNKSNMQIVLKVAPALE